ncbi:hypothetical protein UPYG_G00025230 [Umbra pygmaea]|uniref:Secreted protein n=1 Tax=Umbra pygmaea TaxID=75934 RepID=A0ABD0XLR6_UMBPY
MWKLHSILCSVLLVYLYQLRYNSISSCSLNIKNAPPVFWSPFFSNIHNNTCVCDRSMKNTGHMRVNQNKQKEKTCQVS